MKWSPVHHASPCRLKQIHKKNKKKTLLKQVDLRDFKGPNNTEFH